MEVNHESRAHALLSASSAHRWLECTPSARLEEMFPDTSGEAAKEGTLAHELAELKIRHYFYTVDFGKRKLTTAINKLKKEELWQDEMMGYTDDYVDYLKSIAMAFPNEPYVAIEKKVDFSECVPEGFGTADCILIGGNVLHVIDFKYGKSPDGRVEAEHNPQMLLYALGAFQAYKMLFPITTIRLSIVQPRISDGISEWECSVDELLQFGQKVKELATLAYKGDGEFKPSKKTCKYCRAKAQCRARAEENVKLAFFSDKKPPLITNEEVGEFLRKGEDVSKWLKDLQEYALKECLAGNHVPGWKAVEGKGNRVFTDQDTALETLKKNGFDEAVLYKREPYTLAQLEKTIGKKDFNELVGEYIVKQAGKPTLAKEQDKREAITNKVSAKDAFKEEI